jgi:hypothetical protein
LMDAARARSSANVELWVGIMFLPARYSWSGASTWTHLTGTEGTRRTAEMQCHLVRCGRGGPLLVHDLLARQQDTVSCGGEAQLVTDRRLRCPALDLLCGHRAPVAEARISSRTPSASSRLVTASCTDPVLPTVPSVSRIPPATRGVASPTRAGKRSGCACCPARRAHTGDPAAAPVPPAEWPYPRMPDRKDGHPECWRIKA